MEKQIAFEISVSHYKGREYIKGSVRDILYDGKTGALVAESLFANAVQRAYLPTVEMEKIALSTAEITELIRKKREECNYGLCLIASDRRTLMQYENLEDLGCDLFDFSSKNVANTLIVSPLADVDFSGFRDIVFLDTPPDFNLRTLFNRKVYFNGEICGYQNFCNLPTSRERLLEIFSALRRDINQLNGGTAEELAFVCDGLGFDKREFIFAVNVFEELGLVAFGEGKLNVYRGIKAELGQSAIYRKVCALKNV